MFNWVYRKLDHVFLFGGPCEQTVDEQIHGIVSLLEHPDVRLHRYDGAGGKRDATAQEIADYDAEQDDNRAGSDAEVKALKAALLLTRAYCNALKSELRGLAVLLVQKGVITANEANGLLAYDGDGAGDSKTTDNLRTDYIAIWKGLP